MSEELKNTSREAGKQLASALTNSLTKSGFEVVGPVQTLCDEDDWGGIDSDVRAFLRRQLHFEIMKTDRENPEVQYDWALERHMEELQRKLQLPQADAVVLLTRTSGFDPPAIRPQKPASVKTAEAIIAIAGLSAGDPKPMGHVLAGSDDKNSVNNGPPAKVNYRLYLFNSHTGQLIFDASYSDTRKSPRHAVGKLVKSLPQIVFSQQWRNTYDVSD